jgi:hypothetical protein
VAGLLLVEAGGYHAPFAALADGEGTVHRERTGIDRAGCRRLGSDP